MERGYALSPPFAQLIVGHSQQFWLTVRQEPFPELQVGSSVQIQCLSNEIEATKQYCGLEAHPAREGVLRALWKIKALRPTTATGVRVRVGPITAESIVEVLASEAEKYKAVTEFCFSKKRYAMRTDQRRKTIRVLAPMATVPAPAQFTAETDCRHFVLSGEWQLRPYPDLGVALCDLTLKCDGEEASGTLIAILNSQRATASVESHRPLGADLSFTLADIDLGNQRYRWRQNLLEIAARHPSIKRYLGDKEQGFPGQDSKHFRVLEAEIVADAVCALVVRRSVQANPEEYEDADWDLYYQQYSKLMTQFGPVAHRVVCPEG